MRRRVYWQQIQLGMQRGLELDQDLAGYILDQPPSPAPSASVRVWGYALVVVGRLGDSDIPVVAAPPSLHHHHQPELETGPSEARPSSRRGTSPKRLLLRPIGRLAPATNLQWEPTARPQPPTSLPPAASPPASPSHVSSPPLLRPMRSGRAYRLTSPPERGLVRPSLAEALETIFERFASEHGFTPDRPLKIQLSRGFKAGSHGHGEGRAADIAAVEGKSLLAWKQEWDREMAAAQKLPDIQQRAEAIAAEQQRNLGYGLYKALQIHGGWRVNPKGWRVYQGVPQLFGPWTAIEGPWRLMQIENPNAYQKERLADQQWVFQVHQDHIHVAR